MDILFKAAVDYLTRVLRQPLTRMNSNMPWA